MRNCCCYWACLPANSPGEHTALGKLAEGEELGSNLLHAGQRSPAYPSEAERMAETAELGSNNLSHDLARVGTIPAYQKFWHVDGPQFLPAQRDAAAGEKKRFKCWLFCPRFCARRSARSVAIRTASMLFGQHQSFARQRWTLPAAP